MFGDGNVLKPGQIKRTHSLVTSSEFSTCIESTSLNYLRTRIDTHSSFEYWAFCVFLVGLQHGIVTKEK